MRVSGTDDKAPLNKHVKQFVKSYIGTTKKSVQYKAEE
jgi:hypothetical protein